MPDRETAVLDQFELLLRQGKSVEDARATFEAMGVDSELIDRVIELRRNIIKERFLITIGASVVDPEDGPTAWYSGPQSSDRFWPALRAHLEQDPKWREAVPALDEASTDVVGLLADPHSDIIATRGLVLGYVQSGKTANFTATIAKAADAGYRLFIVLSGVHNALRRQTQLRLEQHLEDLHPANWLSLTDEHRDFGNPVRALPLVKGTDLRLLAVVKKNVSRLTRLRDWLQKAHDAGGLDNCPVLIIDDEADHASPNAASSPELEPTRVNERIRELLKFPRVAYVGYTATPFANVLINPVDARDIYPRSFIYSLPKPATYFGAEELFGIGVSEDDETGSAIHDVIRYVPSFADEPRPEVDEAAQYRIAKGQPFKPVITPSLDTAIRWFLMATAGRRARDGRAEHSSMLVHTTQRVDPQLAFLKVIRDHLRELRTDWNTGSRHAWEQLWIEESERERAENHGLRPISFSEVAAEMPPVLDEVKVVADNSRSTDRLIYGDEPKPVIAVGGNTLSRGLTLEGLLCSFFLRTASTYDSLLQMGRWFGYRVGYSDLPRIWTTRDLASDFRFLSEIEADIRSDIERYAQQNVTPLDLAVRIRLHPRMKIASPNKMHFARNVSASFSGQRPQTTYFRHRDVDVVQSNLEAARRLLQGSIEAGSALVREDSRIILRDIDVTAVLEFIDSYDFHDRSELGGHALRGYIEGQNAHGSLLTWNIAVITRAEPNREIDLGLSTKVGVITRSKLRATSDNGTANIGTLMSKPDRVADVLASATAATMTDAELERVRNESRRALLLLYPIDRSSEPRRSAKNRERLDAVDDLIGVGFAFPRAVPGSEPTDPEMVSVDPELLDLARAGFVTDEDEAGSEEYSDDEGSRDEVSFDDE